MIPTEKDIRFFEENGYWLAGKMLGDAELEPLRQAHEEVFAGQYETGREPYARDEEPGDVPGGVRTMENSHRASSTIRRLVESPTLGESAARLMRTPEVRLWQDQLLFQPGQGADATNSAGNAGWRQDALSWRCTVFDLITAWVAFDDVALEQGCLQVVPGSHRWGLFEAEALLNADLEQLQRQVQERVGHECRPLACELKAGEVVFHHCLAIHGSGPNPTDRLCRSLAIHLQPAHAYYIPGTPSDEHMNVALLRQSGGHAGDLFRGDSWPVLHPKGRPSS